MEGYFSSTVVVLYLLANYAAEPIFVIACLFGTAYSLSAIAFLRWGGCGRMICAQRKAKRFVRKGMISGDSRSMFFERCVKKTPLAFRTAYFSFVAGNISSEELADVGVRSIRVRRKLLHGGAIGGTILFSLLVFMTFYFIVPFSETLLRTVICAFHGTVSCITARLVLYFYTSAGEKAAVSLSQTLDRSLLRMKKETSLLSRECFGKEEEVSFPHIREDLPDRKEIGALRELLRELDERSSVAN